MKIQSNVFVISVLILGLITSPLSFAQTGEDDSQNITIELEESVVISHIDEIELKGILTVTGDDTFNLETEDGIETISINADTEIDDDLSLSDLDGLEVEVDAVLINGVLFATEIEFEAEEEEDEHEERSFGDKITICHIPPGNPNKSHTITIGGNAVDTHLAHGDEIGSCTLGQEISNFVHESRNLFKQQKEETKTVIAQCREDMKNAEPSERKSVREECKSNLKEIRKSYKSLRETYHETFKEFRENMKVFIQESKGLPIDDSTRNAAIASIELLSDSAEKKELLRELQHKMNEEIREEKHKLREELKKERKIAREAMKEQRESERDAEKEQRETMKEQRESEREAEKSQREAERATTNP